MPERETLFFGGKVAAAGDERCACVRRLQAVRSEKCDWFLYDSATCGCKSHCSG